MCEHVSCQTADYLRRVRPEVLEQARRNAAAREERHRAEAAEKCWGIFHADENGVYVTNPQTGQRIMLTPWADKQVLPDEYLRMCRFPFLQDESCNRPGGHDGEHAHLNTAQLDSEKYAPPLFDGRCLGSFMSSVFPSPYARCELDAVHTGPHGKKCVPGGQHFYAAGAQDCRCGNTGMRGS